MAIISPNLAEVHARNELRAVKAQRTEFQIRILEEARNADEGSGLLNFESDMRVER